MMRIHTHHGRGLSIPAQTTLVAGNTDAQATVSDAMCGWGVKPRFECDSMRVPESALFMATAAVTKAKAMKPHTGPAAGKEDPGG